MSDETLFLEYLEAVERVGAYHTEARWIEYQRFVSHAARRLDETRPCFELDRRADRVEGVQTYLRLTDVDGRPFAPPTDLLHAWVRHSDGEVAARVPIGSVDVPSSESPEYLTFENVTPVAAADTTRIGSERHWQLISQFAIHPRDLASASGLTELVSFARAGRAGRAHPDVVDVVSRPAMRLHRRMMVEVRDIDITLEGRNLEGGERLLFARILNQLFARPVGSRVFSRVTARFTDGAQQPLRFEPH